MSEKDKIISPKVVPLTIKSPADRAREVIDSILADAPRSEKLGIKLQRKLESHCEVANAVTQFLQNTLNEKLNSATSREELLEDILEDLVHLLPEMLKNPSKNKVYDDSGIQYDQILPPLSIKLHFDSTEPDPNKPITDSLFSDLEEYKDTLEVYIGLNQILKSWMIDNIEEPFFDSKKYSTIPELSPVNTKIDVDYNSTCVTVTFSVGIKIIILEEDESEE